LEQECRTRNAQDSVKESRIRFMIFEWIFSRLFRFLEDLFAVSARVLVNHQRNIYFSATPGKSARKKLKNDQEPA
jgi:hypothetical protein